MTQVERATSHTTTCVLGLKLKIGGIADRNAVTIRMVGFVHVAVC
jgi:hypothetical protein